MPRPPNYNQERQERDRAKAKKKAEKLALKAAAKERGHESVEPDTTDESEDTEK